MALAGARIEDGRLVAEGRPRSSPALAAANAEARPWLSLDWPADAARCCRPNIVIPDRVRPIGPLTSRARRVEQPVAPGASQLHNQRPLDRASGPNLARRDARGDRSSQCRALGQAATDGGLPG